MRRFILDPNNLPSMSKEARARLDAMTDEEITAAAELDPDNPPLTDDELARLRLARRVQAVRARTGGASVIGHRLLVAGFIDVLVIYELGVLLDIDVGDKGTTPDNLFAIVHAPGLAGAFDTAARRSAR